jgi:hypothetical protein
VGEQGAEDGVVEIVDRGVALADGRGLGGVAGGEGVEHVVHHLGRDPRHFGEQRQGPDLAVLDARHALGDVLGIVADPLDHAGDLERGDDLAQIVGHRRAQGDDLHRLALDLGLERVDPGVALDDRGGGLRIAADERLHGVADRRLGEAAHLAWCRAACRARRRRL